MKKAIFIQLTLICLFIATSVKGQEKARVEKDLLGEKQTPAEAYHGVQTARALENTKNWAPRRFPDG
jgi:aspartate ammonia-lyase